MRRRHLATAAVMTASCVMLLGLYAWARGPSNARITPASSGVQGASTQDYTVTSQSNPHLTYSLPARFVSRTKSTAEGHPILFQQLFGATNGSTGSLYPDQMAVTVGHLPSDGLSGLGDVQFRQRNSDYEQLYFDWLEPFSGMAFQKKTGGYELGIFVYQKDMYASFVQSGLVDKREQIIHEMSQLLGTVEWAE